MRRWRKLRKFRRNSSWKEEKVDDDLKVRIGGVADAVDEALAKDSQIRKVVQKIENAGYDVAISIGVILKLVKNPKNKKNTEDEKFLRSLGIDPKDLL
jgi:hypothetical protein